MGLQEETRTKDILLEPEGLKNMLNLEVNWDPWERCTPEKPRKLRELE